MKILKSLQPKKVIYFTGSTKVSKESRHTISVKTKKHEKSIDPAWTSFASKSSTKLTNFNHGHVPGSQGASRGRVRGCQDHIPLEFHPGRAVSW